MVVVGVFLEGWDLAGLVEVEDGGSGCVREVGAVKFGEGGGWW